MSQQLQLPDCNQAFKMLILIKWRQRFSTEADLLIAFHSRAVADEATFEQIGPSVVVTLRSSGMRKELKVQCDTDFHSGQNPYNNNTQELLFGLRLDFRLISSITQQQQQKQKEQQQISFTWYDYLLHWSSSPDCWSGWNISDHHLSDNG